MAVGAAGWAVLLAAGTCAHPGLHCSVTGSWHSLQKQLNDAQSLNCVGLGGAEWSWWSPLDLICALGFLNSTVLSS